MNLPNNKETNTFYCSICQEYTRHLEVGMLEMSGRNNGGTFDRLTGAVLDFTGSTKLLDIISDQKRWKCCQCGRIWKRTIGGKLIAHYEDEYD